ncbi:hypothetical protein DM02DRAFT_662133 [Periconia macrospinosa]|uniref:Uncharacterized protein n=1 Tax=Periconia macrospinosa TaxID=97972 RepID=A0A2V1D5C7_9PLEO|nr:hypothetical protein DM02DRAFT_662133 [Periconia macrospinosa]
MSRDTNWVHRRNWIMSMLSFLHVHNSKGRTSNRDVSPYTAYEAALDLAFPRPAKDEERTKFLAWYAGLRIIEMQTADLMAKEPIDSAKYRQALQSVEDWSSMEQMDKLYSTLFSQGHSQAGSPIYLGQDNGVLYFLQPEIVGLNEGNHLDNPQKSHPYIVEMQTVTREQVPFRYGFCLGTLRYAFQEGGGSSGGGDTKPPARLPFHVYLDVGSADKDIWIVFATSFIDSNGEAVPLDARTNPWDWVFEIPIGHRAIMNCSTNNFASSQIVDTYCSWLPRTWQA